MIPRSARIMNVKTKERGVSAEDLSSILYPFALSPLLLAHTTCLKASTLWTNGRFIQAGRLLPLLITHHSSLIRRWTSNIDIAIADLNHRMGKPETGSK